MPENSWRESDSYNEQLPINSLLSDLSGSLSEALPDLEAELELDPDEVIPYRRGFPGRRRKAAIALTAIWSGTIALHLVSWGSWFVLGLTTLMGVHFLRVLLARPIPVPEPLNSDNPEDYPYVSLLVAAKNEEAVIASLVKDLCQLDYPADRYDLWVIDDNSSDRTPLVLERLQQEYVQLNVVRRPANAIGGKSGALNQVWSQAKGDIIVVFDADAQVPNDLLRRVMPLFQRQEVGAVQVQKAVANAGTNFWTRAQVAEMAMDSHLQRQRIAVGGVGELRGNGQFVRRAALESCGGWNEETITDDLDLTIRLHLDHWDIDFLMLPAVAEEGVTNAIGLWHQRNRWAEGGYQRYLDYWRLILRNRMGTQKTADLFFFWLIQYVLPTASIPDFLMAISRSCPPLFAPLTSLMFLFSLLGMFMGLRSSKPSSLGINQHRRIPRLPTNRLGHSLLGTAYMFHWLPVMASTTARMAVRPKRLKWVKTVHRGSDEVLDIAS
ncbi:glycosyltransferase [Egbenema bharatensis]|uniref:glycosyltransferase n=1 Tax=Egbenema bharatensis TaxID=3463334 RepID=UPI003A838119